MDHGILPALVVKLSQEGVMGTMTIGAINFFTYSGIVVAGILIKFFFTLLPPR